MFLLSQRSKQNEKNISRLRVIWTIQINKLERLIITVLLRHELRKICDIIEWSLLNWFANDVAAVANEIVGGRRTLHICCSISNHHNRQLIIRYQLTWIEDFDLGYSFTFSATARSRLIYVKSSIISIVIEQQLVGKQVCKWNFEFLTNL